MQINSGFGRMVLPFPLGVSTNTFSDGWQWQLASCSFVVTVRTIKHPKSYVLLISTWIRHWIHAGHGKLHYTNRALTIGRELSTIADIWPFDGATFPLGWPPIRLVTDGSGQHGELRFCGNRGDNQAPQIVCPSNINVNTALNTCGAMVNYTTAIGTDNCGGSSTMQTSGLSDGATFPLGVTTNTFGGDGWRWQHGGCFAVRTTITNCPSGSSGIRRSRAPTTTA